MSEEQAVAAPDPLRELIEARLREIYAGGGDGNHWLRNFVTAILAENELRLMGIK